MPGLSLPEKLMEMTTLLFGKGSAKTSSKVSRSL